MPPASLVPRRLAECEWRFVRHTVGVKEILEEGLNIERGVPEADCALAHDRPAVADEAIDA